MAHPYVDGSLVVPFPLFRLAFRRSVALHLAREQ